MKEEHFVLDHPHSIQAQQQTNQKTVYPSSHSLPHTKHYYFLPNIDKNLSIPYAVWNLCILHSNRPALCLIICSNQNQISELTQTCKLARKYVVVTEDSHQTLREVIEMREVEIVVTTDRKISILCSLDQINAEFSLILNIGFHKDPEHYCKIQTFLASSGGTIISFPKNENDLQQIKTSTNLVFEEVSATLSAQDQRKELLSSIKFMPEPKIETLLLVKDLPFPVENCFARIFEHFQAQFITQKSKHLRLPNYITYQLKTSVEFNSLKYIWNYLGQLPQKIRSSIKGLAKFTNNRGVVFDIPQIYKQELEEFIQKQQKNIQKYKVTDRKYWLQKLEFMPQIDDINSEDYKKKQGQIEFAMKNKNDLELFVGGLSTSYEEVQIRQIFTQKGVNILTVRILRDRSGISKGVCFILCASFEDAKKALQMNQDRIGDRPIRVHLAEKREERGHEKSRERSRSRKPRRSQDCEKRLKERSYSRSPKKNKSRRN